MLEGLRKIVRTIESGFPCIPKARVKDTKESVLLHARRTFRIPHERDFKALALFPACANECLVDIGANRGQSIESMLLFRPGAQIVAFEANPVLARELTARYRDRTNIRMVPCGLSDSTGKFILFVPSYKGFVYDGLSSLDKTAAASWICERTVLGFDRRRITIQELECTTDTLDAQGLAPSFIKIDVQGHEFSMLHGGRKTLRQYEPVLLVELFRADPRTVQLAEELGYEEYYFDGDKLRKGAPTQSPNSFLITRSRARALFGSAGV